MENTSDNNENKVKTLDNASESEKIRISMATHSELVALSQDRAVVNRKRKHEMLDDAESDPKRVKESRIESKSDYNLLYEIGRFNEVFSILISICGLHCVASLAFLSKNMLEMVRKHMKGGYILDSNRNQWMNVFIPGILYLDVNRLSLAEYYGRNLVTIKLTNYDDYIVLDSYGTRPECKILGNFHLTKELHLLRVDSLLTHAAIKCMISQMGRTLQKVLVQGDAIDSLLEFFDWEDTKDILVLDYLLVSGDWSIPRAKNVRICLGRGDYELELPDTITCLEIQAQKQDKYVKFKIPKSLKYLNLIGLVIPSIDLSEGVPCSLTHLRTSCLVGDICELLKNSKITHLYLESISLDVIKSLPVSIKVLVVGRFECYDRSRSSAKPLHYGAYNTDLNATFAKCPTYSFSLQGDIGMDSLNNMLGSLNFYVEEKLGYVGYNDRGEPTRTSVRKYDLSRLIHMEDLVIPYSCESLVIAGKLKTLVWSTASLPSWGRANKRRYLYCSEFPEKIIVGNRNTLDLISIIGAENAVTKNYAMNTCTNKKPHKCLDRYNMLKYTTI